MRVLTVSLSALLTCAGATDVATAGTTELVPGSADSLASPLAVSGTGRFVIYTVSFCIFAGCAYEGFLFDRRTGKTSGVGCPACPIGPVDDFPTAISRDGRFILGATDEANEGAFNVYLIDRRTAVTAPVAVALGGQELDSGSTAAALSADGRYAL